jgi:hypothetical protein
MEHGESDSVGNCAKLAPSTEPGIVLWLLGGFRSLPFQLIITPVRWVNETATVGADHVAMEMDSQAHLDENNRRMAGYLASMLSEMRGGHSLYPPYPTPGH